MEKRDDVYDPDGFPLDADELTDEEFRELQSQAAVFIREIAWLDKGPPRRYTPPGWNMGRELSVWKQLARRHGAARVNAAIQHARAALGIPSHGRFTMLIFNGKGKRHRLRQAIQYWEKLYESTVGGDRIKSGLRELLGGKA